MPITGIDSNQALFAGSAKATGVLRIDYDASSENHFIIFFRKGDRKLEPVKQVSANGMSPTHVSPLITQGIELKEEVVLTMKINEPVRIVSPMSAWGEMHLWTIALLVNGLSARERQSQHG